MDEQGKLTNDKQEIATILNKYFATVFVEEEVLNIPVAIVRKNLQQPDKLIANLDNILITQRKVEVALNSLKPNKSAGGMDLILAIYWHWLNILYCHLH